MISRMFYPLGFIVVILGRSQLFTENTLYPVALVLTEPRQIWNTLRLWATVLPSNMLGALTFAALAGLTRLDAGGRGAGDCGARAGGGAAAGGSDLLERRGRGMDHRDGGVAGVGVALNYRVGDGDLGVDVCGGAGKLCALHCDLRRDLDGGADAPAGMGGVSDAGLGRRWRGTSAAAWAW